ncbi:MAG: nuclear transport factor 2 family protein [Acidimicrobiia bacterium]
MTSTPNNSASEQDLVAIRRAVADYCEGYYRRDPDQTYGAYHPECLKRAFELTEDDVTYLIVQTRASMVDVARISSRATEPEFEVFIDNVIGDIATVRLYSNAWVDYLHVVKARGDWKLLHAAYDERPAQRAEASDASIEAITQAATDYVEGWYLARPQQHLGAYHDECVKRVFTPDGGMAVYSGTHMAEICAKRSPDATAEWTITIDDVVGSVATVRIDSTDFVDHLHIAHARGRWGLLHGSFHVKG